MIRHNTILRFILPPEYQNTRILDVLFHTPNLTTRYRNFYALMGMPILHSQLIRYGGFVNDHR